MHSVLTSAPAVEPLSLDEAKLHLRVTRDAEDEPIARMIKAARRQVEAASGLRLIRQSWSVFMDDWPGCGEIRLPVAPAIEIEALSVHGEDGASAEIDPAHYCADLGSRPARIVLRPWRVWARPGRIADGIEVALVAGFGAAGAAVPEPLREAMLKLVAQWFEDRGDGEAGRAPPGFAALVAPYRELRI